MADKSFMSVCGACGEDALHARCGVRAVAHEGVADVVRHLFHECDSCGAVLFNETDVRENRRSWIRFKKQLEGTPLGCEIRAMRLQNALTQAEAGELFGGGPVAFSKYETDDLVPDAAMSNLLRLAIAFPKTIDQLRAAKARPVRIQVLDYSPAVELPAYFHVTAKPIAAPVKSAKEKAPRRLVTRQRQAKTTLEWKTELWTTH